MLWLEIDSKGIFCSILATSLLHPSWAHCLEVLQQAQRSPLVRCADVLTWPMQPKQTCQWSRAVSEHSTCGAGSQRARTAQAGLAGLGVQSGNRMMCMNGGIRIVHPNHSASSSSFPEPNSFLVFPFFSYLCWAQDFHCTYNSLILALKGITLLVPYRTQMGISTLDGRRKT